jgi:DNA-directed RNA polymerase subunit M
LRVLTEGLLKLSAAARIERRATFKNERRSKTPCAGGGLSVEFCPKCGSLLVPVSSEGKTYLVCRKCGYKKEASSKKGYMVRGEVTEDKKEKLLVVEGIRNREKEKIEEEREIIKEYYEVFLESMESEEE